MCLRVSLEPILLIVQSLIPMSCFVYLKLFLQFAVCENSRMTNRPKSTTDSDQQIAARIKIFREGLRWSQSDFARMLDLSRNMVANIESGRTPLRYDVAWEISEKFDYHKFALLREKLSLRSPVR